MCSYVFDVSTPGSTLRLPCNCPLVNVGSLKAELHFIRGRHDFILHSTKQIKKSCKHLIISEL